MSYRKLLKNWEYRLLFAGQATSQIGDAIYEVGIVWLVFQMTGSPAALGWLALSQSLPFLVCGILAGAYADRLDRRTTMLVSDLIRGVAVVYLLVRYLSGGLTVWEVCLASVLLTVARSFFHPSMRALFPQILPREQLLHANSLSESAKRIAKVGGMMLGGLLMATERADLVLIINGASFFLSAATIWFLSTRTEIVQRVGKNIFREIKTAAGEIGRNRTALFAILLSSLGLIVSSGLVKIGLPLIAGEGDAYGFLMASFAVGMFLSAALLNRLSRLSLVAMVLVGWALYGAAFLGLAFTPPLYAAAVLVFLTGFAHFLTDIPVTTHLQQTMPLERMSACQSIWATASFGSESLSAAGTGLLLAGATVAGGFAAAGGFLLLLGVVPLIILRLNGQIILDRRSMAE